MMRFSSKCLLLVLLSFLLQAEVFAINSKSFKVTIDPLEYDVSHLVPDPNWPQPTSGPPQEFILTGSRLCPLRPSHPIYSDTKFPPGFTPRPGVNLNIPRKLIIEVESGNLDQFSWRKIQIPVVIAVRYDESMIEKGVSMSFSDRASKKMLKTIPIEIEAWAYSYVPTRPEWEDKESIYQRPIHDSGFGQKDYWNMTYFVALPKCSMSYDFWVTVRGVESAHKPFDIEFYVDGRQITQDNFAEMSEKYPALKENKPDPWPLPSLF